MVNRAYEEGRLEVEVAGQQARIPYRSIRLTQSKLVVVNSRVSRWVTRTLSLTAMSVWDNQIYVRFFLSSMGLFCFSQSHGEHNSATQFQIPERGVISLASPDRLASV